MSDIPTNKMPEYFFRQLDNEYETLEAEFAPDVCNTLGLMAVKGDLARTVILQHDEPWVDEELSSANENVAKFVQDTRDRIAAIDTDRRLEVGTRVLHGNVPEFILNSLGVEYDFHIFDRIVEQNPDGSYALPDAPLLNFLQWHNYSMTAWRERFMQKEWPNLKQIYSNKLKTAVSDGWLPECVLQPQRLDALEQVDVTIDDGMLLAENGTNAFVAFDALSATEVIFPPYTYLDTAYHELSHVMVGVDTSNNRSEIRLAGNLKTHGLYRLFDEEHLNAGRALDEAVTEHIARTMSEYPSSPDVIDPANKKSGLGVYIKERELLDTLCNGGEAPIDLRLFTRAYFEDSSRMRKPALKQLKREIKKAFPGRDVLTELSELMSHGEYEVAREDLGHFAQSLRKQTT